LNENKELIKELKKKIKYLSYWNILFFLFMISIF
jgi:hypothetical protein